MYDRELLELAAKAIGTEFVPGESWDEGAGWNPLTDDGDAFRLAVKLKLNIHNSAHSPSGIEFIYAQTRCHPPKQEYDLADPYAATRRAIVRAAAEIGRNTKWSTE